MDEIDELPTITREEAIKELKDCQACQDIESAHWEADNILCRVLKSLGETDLVREWQKVAKWYA